MDSTRGWQVSSSETDREFLDRVLKIEKIHLMALECNRILERGINYPMLELYLTKTVDFERKREREYRAMRAHNHRVEQKKREKDERRRLRK